MTQVERQARKEEMFSKIEQCHQSGLNKKMFCQQNGIAPSLFYYWLKKYKENKEDISGFVPIKVRGQIKFTDPAIEVQYPNGVCLRLTGSASGQMLRMLVNLV